MTWLAPRPWRRNSTRRICAKFCTNSKASAATRFWRYDGHIAQFLGDRVLTYFGFPRAHEDDAERAVRAALQAIVSASKFATRGGQMHEIRIGIATGLVVVGDLIGDGFGPRIRTHWRGAKLGCPFAGTGGAEPNIGGTEHPQIAW